MAIHDTTNQGNNIANGMRNRGNNTANGTRMKVITVHMVLGTKVVIS